MKGKLKEFVRLAGGEYQVTFTTRDNPGKIFNQIKDQEATIEIKKAGNRRTKTANDFCWALCTDIGNALRPPLPKEEVYRMAIRDVGEYEPLPIRADAVERFQKCWSEKGIGWFADVIDDSKLPGYKLVFAYYGSSTYDSATMARLIDHLRQDAENMDIVIPLSKAEEERLLKSWGK